MIELILSLVVDLSEQKLTVLNSNQKVVRVIAVSNGKPQHPPPSDRAVVH